MRRVHKTGAIDGRENDVGILGVSFAVDFFQRKLNENFNCSKVIFFFFCILVKIVSELDIIL